MSNTEIELSVVLPCRNEEDSIAACITDIQKVFKDANINGEIIVSDSSSDASPDISRKLGAQVVKHDKVGYGRAYLEGFAAARGTYLFCADADGTYEFSEIPRFLNLLKQGNDFVIGNRFTGTMAPDAMPWHHRYIGNPILSFVTRRLFNTPVSDVHCGMRALKRACLPQLDLHTTGMEFASEMVVKAAQQNLKTVEVPINYQPRIGVSKLRSFRDGWRHLRLLLLYSPFVLFFWPGIFLCALGIATTTWLLTPHPTIFGIELFFHPLFASTLLIIIGYQLIIFAFFAKVYAMLHLGAVDTRIEALFQYITLERASLFGLAMLLLGIGIYAFIGWTWFQSGFGALDHIQLSIIGLTATALGVQTISSGFMLSTISIRSTS